jgi:hypothetical protein
MRHIVCFSGGHSSALVAAEVVNKFGSDNVVLLNHDMHFLVEDPSIKLFRAEVAAKLGLPVTQANYMDAQFDQFDVCVDKAAFKVKNGQEFCTYVLKTLPFMQWLDANCPDKDAIIYYGFDANETDRIQRRSSILAASGFRTDFPLAFWEDRTIFNIEKIGVKRPKTYAQFIHANCIGCLKAGLQHWYVVYCTRPDIWLKGKWAEEEIGHAIHHGDDGPVYLEDMEPKFEVMRLAGIPATERIPQQKFWAVANKVVKINAVQQALPCECFGVA